MSDPKTNSISITALLVSIIFCAFCVFAAPQFTFCQEKQQYPTKPIQKDDRELDESPSLGDMVVKQQISRRRKEHEDLIKRGEDALKLSEELEGSVALSQTLNNSQVEKLQSLEKLVGRIRKDLGGDDEEEEVVEDSSGKENTARQSISTAIKFLKESTKTLVDELKRTSRFSISAVAIQTSNSVIRFARFLRLKK